MSRTTKKAGILAVGILLACGAGAWAHAFLDHADPKVGSEVAAPGEVKIWFTEEIEPAFSSIQVLDAAGNQVDKKDFHVDPADKKLGIVSVGALAAGTYKVVWQVVATDTHKTHGEFTFKVKAARGDCARRYGARDGGGLATGVAACHPAVAFFRSAKR